MQQPSLKQFHGLTLYGFSTRTQNHDEFNANTAKIPALWQKCTEKNVIQSPEIYGVYSDYQSDANDFYTLTVGTTQSCTLPDIVTKTLLPGTYFVFANEGPMPETVIKTWQEIWAYFANDPKYLRNFKTDFELYSEQNKIEIYIGIQRQ